MLKVTDAYEIVHRKITRNKVLMEIYKLYEELLGCEIILKNEKIFVILTSCKVVCIKSFT